MIRTLYGTAVNIIALEKPFCCNGQEIERVWTENIDEKSVTYGHITLINVENLIPRDEVRKAIDRLKGKAERVTGQLELNLGN